jgi:hypothetical protein
MKRIFIIILTILIGFTCLSQEPYVDKEKGITRILKKISHIISGKAYIDEKGDIIIDDRNYISGENHLTQTTMLVDRYDFELTDNQKYYIDTIIQCLIDSSVFDKLHAAYFGFYGHDDQAAYQNWIGNYDNLTQINGDIYFLAKWGIKGTSITGGPCLTMQNTLKTICDSSKFSYGLYLEERVASVAKFINGSYNGITSNWLLSYEGTSVGPTAYINGSIIVYYYGTVPFMCGWSRNENNCYAYKNGTQVGTASDVPVSLPNYEMYILGRNNSGTNQASYDGRISCFYISKYGVYLTPEEHRAVYNVFIKWKNYADVIF